MLLGMPLAHIMSSGKSRMVICKERARHCTSADGAADNCTQRKLADGSAIEGMCSWTGYNALREYHKPTLFGNKGSKLIIRCDNMMMYSPNLPE